MYNVATDQECFDAVAYKCRVSIEYLLREEFLYKRMLSDHMTGMQYRMGERVDGVEGEDALFQSLTDQIFCRGKCEVVTFEQGQFVLTQVVSIVWG